MHTLGFKPEDLDVEIHREPVALADLFPDMHKLDRLGVVVRSSIGLLGSFLLMQAFAAAYFQHRRRHGRLVPHYPEIYAFHIGGRYGDFRMVDVLPERKEVFVSSAEKALEAINQCGITRIALPVAPASPSEFHPWEVGPAEDRIRTTYLYGPAGQVERPAIVIRGKGRQVFDSFRCVFDPQHTINEHGPSEPPEWSQSIRERAGEVENRGWQLAKTRWDAALEAGSMVESYEILRNASDFLKYL